MPPYEEYCNEIRELWDTHWLTNRGTKHRQLEDELRVRLGVVHAALFVNGHSALECILEALELGKDGRDEVITTPFTFVSTVHALVRKGLKPVFCDIKPDDFTIDPEKIEPLITERTAALLPVHVYGNICDVDAIASIAHKNKLKVIYDAAHAFGVEHQGVGAGAFGDASMFSFHATKVFNTIEGGAITYADEGLSDKLVQWGNFGIVDPESVAYIGGNAKMNEFSAAMGICNFRHIDEEIEKRKRVFEAYQENLYGVSGIKTPIIAAGTKPNYAYYPIVVDEAACGATRDELFELLAKHHMGARKYFYPLVSDYECYCSEYDSAITPVARWVSARVLTLPLFADLEISDVVRICDIIKGRVQHG